MRALITHTVDKLTRTGAESSSAHESRRIRLTNIVSLLAVFFNVSYSAFFALQGWWQPILFNTVVCLVYLSVLWLNQKQFSRLASLLLLGTATVHLTVQANVFLGPGSGAHYFLFLIPTFSFLLLQWKEKPWIFVLSLVAVSMFGFTEYGSFTSSLLVGASENIQTGLHIVSTTSTIFFLFVVVFLFYIYLNRALEDLELERAVERVRTAELEHELKVAQEFLKEARDRVDGPLLGDSVAVRGLREAVEVYAATDETLLLAGPPGAGQEAIARCIHHESNRGSRPFIHVNCALLHTSAQEALFGTLPPESGSDAIPDVGKFDLANAGTLFLEGVNELTAKVQERLAETLEKLERQRAEGRRPSPDVRAIAYSSRDLAQETTDGRFIPSLHQLLSKRQLTVPALAERREDIPALAEHFIHQHARRLGKTIEGVSPESMERLQSYRWQGNIRELSNLLERVIVGASGPQLEIEESLLEGGITLDRYRLVEKLGEGGMGEVWRAQHQLLARPAAVKLIRSEALVDVQRRESVLKRFQREAQVTANLQSPNTVKLYDFGVSETGSFYFVMELLSGIDLESMVKRFGELKAERVVMLLRQACRSLSEAHGAGLVHRDIKPANLFVCKLGRECDFIKVLDFGIVKPTVQTGQSMLTAAGAVTGTPAYMAPELFLDKGEVDGRADIYALGCVAFCMLTGRLVFESTNPMELLLQHAKTPPEPPSRFTELSIPKSLDQLVLACLEKKPDDRPNSADELWRVLGQIEFDDPWTLERAEEWWLIHMPEHSHST